MSSCRTRKDATNAVVTLSQKLSGWCSAADRRLSRLFGYVGATLEYCLVSQSVDGVTVAELFMGGHSDTDHGGCEETRRSVTGADVTLLRGFDTVRDEGVTPLDLDVFVPCGHLAKRHGATSRSSTKADVIGANDTLVTVALPVLGVIEQAFGVGMGYPHRIGNDAARLLCRDRLIPGTSAHAEAPRDRIDLVLGLFRPPGPGSQEQGSQSRHLEGQHIFKPRRLGASSSRRVGTSWTCETFPTMRPPSTSAFRCSSMTSSPRLGPIHGRSWLPPVRGRGSRTSLAVFPVSGRGGRRTWPSVQFSGPRKVCAWLPGRPWLGHSVPNSHCWLWLLT